MGSKSGEGKMVCVTGGSGYIASWIIKLLLERGYTVNTTVRDPNDERKTAHLLVLDGAKERLHFYKADLLEEGSFDAAISGCLGVFHTASPVPLIRAAMTDPQAQLVEPAWKGTLNVFRSCAKFPSIRRVIYTSSLAAVTYTGKPLTPDTVIDETWFAVPEVLTEMKLWYNLGKTLAEKTAWKFAKENNIDLVSINPAFVIGPLLQPTPNASTDIILNLISGSKTYPKIHFKTVDVRDVAFAHIQAFEMPSANGRYLLVESGDYMPEVLKIVHKLYPSLPIPEKCDEVDTIYVKFGVSQKKTKTLGLNYIPLEVSLKDTIESFKEKGFLSF